MRNSKTKDSTTRFLIYSFIGLLIFSIIIFSLLGIYMNRKSKHAVYEIGNIYMSGMNKQMSRHFETVIELRFDQVSGIVSVVSANNQDKVAQLPGGEESKLNLAAALLGYTGNDLFSALGINCLKRICGGKGKRINFVRVGRALRLTAAGLTALGLAAASSTAEC